MTIVALQHEAGYRHVQDVRELQHLASWCAVCNLLKEGFLSMVYQNTDRERTLNIETALQKLAPLVEKKGVSLQNPCPLVLRRDWYQVSLGTLIEGPKKCRSSSFDRFFSFSVDMGLSGACLRLDIYEKRVTIPPRERLDEDSLFRRCIEWMSLDRDDSLDVAPLPNRVLDLDPQETGYPALSSDLRLTASSGQMGSYATLSYCWGSYRGCLTEMLSYESRLELIEHSKLPQLFQHAVYVARKLHFRYLWIDALCIIQDSDKDWRQEAALMADIYRNSRLRIAAVAAKDPTEGFYFPNLILPSVDVSHLVTKDLQSSPDANLYKSSCFLTLPMDFGVDVEQSLLSTRAWVFQEGLLSPRTLYFGDDCIHYESERVIMGLGENQPFRSASVKSRIDISDMESREGAKEPSHSSRSNLRFWDTSDAWLHASEAYSRCRITFVKDKLIALSGIMKACQSRGRSPYRGSKFYLGMWETTLCEDLLWVPSVEVKSKSEFKQLASLGLPSWAWISYEGPVRFLKDRRKLDLRSTMQVSPIPEFETPLFSDGHDSTLLPFHERISMTIGVRFTKIPVIGSKLNRRFTEDHVEAVGSSPFRHSTSTRNRPIPLLTWSDCFELRNEENGVLGFFSLDSLDSLPEVDLWCGHIATLHDETYSGPDPLNRHQHTIRAGDMVSKWNSASMLRGENVGTGESHILAYCWVLSLWRDEGKDEYRRVGIAEVKYEWIMKAPRIAITVF